MTEALIVKQSELDASVAELRSMASSLVVSDQGTYVEGCELVRLGRTKMKAIGFALDPGIDSARSHLEELRNRKKQLCNLIIEITSPIETMCESWRSREKEEAKAEEKSLNGNGHVEPNIPTVDGIRGRTNYSATVVSEDALFEAYAKACSGRQIKRKAFLRQFLTINTKALNEYARKLKNPRILEDSLPGIRGEAKESI